MTTMDDRPTTTARSEFDQGIALAARAGESGVYEGILDTGWRIGGGINGGFLLAFVGHALSLVHGGQDGHPDPVSITAHYLSAARPGPAVVRTGTVRRGRSLSTGTASLTQVDEDGSEVERLRVLATYGNLETSGSGAYEGGAYEARTSGTPPELPPPDRCIGVEQASKSLIEQAELLQRIDLRLDPATVGWTVGKPSGIGAVRGWMRLPDGREPDPLLLLMAADILPPATFDLGLPGWAPTIELTVHVRARPVPGWLRVSHVARHLVDGYFEEDAEVWDASGRLVARSRQLARAPRPAKQ